MNFLVARDLVVPAQKKWYKKAPPKVGFWDRRPKNGCFWGVFSIKIAIFEEFLGRPRFCGAALKKWHKKAPQKYIFGAEGPKNALFWFLRPKAGQNLGILAAEGGQKIEPFYCRRRRPKKINLVFQILKNLPKNITFFLKFETSWEKYNLGEIWEI